MTPQSSEKVLFYHLQKLPSNPDLRSLQPTCYRTHSPAQQVFSVHYPANCFYFLHMSMTSWFVCEGRRAEKYKQNLLKQLKGSQSLRFLCLLIHWGLVVTVPAVNKRQSVPWSGYQAPTCTQARQTITHDTLKSS